MRASVETLYVVSDDLDNRRNTAHIAASIPVPCEAFATAEALDPSAVPSLTGCLLIDLRSANTSVLKLQERLNECGCTLPTIVVCADGDVPTSVQAMKNGAVTVLQRSYPEHDLAEAIRAALSLDRTKREDRQTHADTRRRINSLTPRERRLMEAVIAGKPNKQISHEMDVSHRTVDRLRAAVLKKMGADSAIKVASMVAEYRAIGRVQPQRLGAIPPPPSQ